MKRLRITVEGIAYDVTVEELDAGTSPAPMAAPAAAPVAPVASPAPAAAPAAAAPAAAAAGDVTSPLAGTVLKVDVSQGQAVTAGQVLVTLEAMKMNTPVTAPAAGTVTAIRVEAGATVQEGQVLVSLG